MVRWILGAILALAVYPALAQTYPEYANIYVNDYADLLSDDAEETLKEQLQELRAETGVEFTVLTIMSMQEFGHSGAIEPFATGLFNAWGIGDASENNGILMLVSRWDRRIRLEVGAGYGTSKNATMQRIIDDEILPHFRRDAYQAGILSGVEAVFIDIAGARPGEIGASFLQRLWNGIGRFLGWLGLWIVPLLSPLLYFPINAYRRWRRNQPRICPVDGMTMVRMTEELDDTHLQGGQVAEESLRSVDYDVWECQKCNHVTIEAYRAWFSTYSACRACGYRTLQGDTTITREATTSTSGEKRIDYTCHNCGESYTMFHVTPRKRESSSSGSFGGGSSSGGGASGSW